MKPAGIFTDNMVLQRDMALPVWGTADGGEQVAVSIEGQKVETELASKASGASSSSRSKPAGLMNCVSTAPKNQIALKNVLVGDVWIASGQSNMEMNVQSSANAPAEIAGSANSKIRLFTVPRHGAPKPEADVNGHWEEAGPKTVPGFSAVAYFFGRALEKETACAGRADQLQRRRHDRRTLDEQRIARCHSCPERHGPDARRATICITRWSIR